MQISPIIVTISSQAQNNDFSRLYGAKHWQSLTPIFTLHKAHSNILKSSGEQCRNLNRLTSLIPDNPFDAWLCKETRHLDMIIGAQRTVPTFIKSSVHSRDIQYEAVNKCVTARQQKAKRS